MSTAISATLTQSAPGRDVRVTINYLIDGRIEKTKTLTARCPSGKGLDRHLLEMLGADIRLTATLWGREDVLF